MKKMKGVVAASAKMKGVVAARAMESSPLSYATLYEDPKTRIKFHNLMQDYEELYKETQANKDKLQLMKKKKMTLLAEVRFLRQRYKYLIQTQSQYPPVERNYMQPQKVVAGIKNVRKEKYFRGNDTTVRCPVPRFDLNQKGKIQTEREATFRSPVPIFDMNKKQKSYNGKEAMLRNSLPIPDLNQKERLYSGKEVAAQNVTPIFDLNQISMEEEELQANGEAMKMEEPKINFIRGGCDDQHNDIKLSACRNVGNGSGQTGKRKISWQDQVALRV